MALLCPRCGQHEVLPQQPHCPGGCDLTDYWARTAASASPETHGPSAEQGDEFHTPEADAAEPAAEAQEHVPTTLPIEEPHPVAVPAAVPMAEVVCPGCRASVSPEATFCDRCGWPLVPHCAECGTDNRFGALFCRRCGVRLSGARPERRGRTRFCPTCGHPMTGLATGRRTETLAATPTTPSLTPPVAQTIPTLAPEPPRVPEPPTAPPVVELLPATEVPPAIEGEPVPEAPAVIEGEPVAEAPPAVEEPAVEDVPPAGPTPPAREFQLLVVKRDGTPVAAFPLKEGDNLVGVRSQGGMVPSVDLARFDSRKVISRRHAILRVEAGRVLLQDCRSTNGTAVNGHDLTQTPVEVNEESIIEFAGLRCCLRANPAS